MGACSSTPSVAEPVPLQKTKTPEVVVAKTSAPDSASDSDLSLEKDSIRQSRHGYESGASTDELGRSSHHHHRVRTDTSTLDNIKADLLIDGNLGMNVVRIESQFGTPIEEIYDGVHDGPVLGSGVSGIVRKVTHRRTGVEYAVKCLDLGLVKGEEGLNALREEIVIMCQMDHPSIVRLEEAYESDTEIYLIQQLCSGGDLFDRLDEQPDFHYTEAKCAKLVKQMLAAVRYLHSMNIVHRDLKLENFLFQTEDPDSPLRMIDFGLSKHFEFGREMLHDAVGTPYSVAPETILGNYDEKADVWAIGVISFLLLCGDTPFGGACGEDLGEVRDNILRGRYAFEPKEAWDLVSDEGKGFVRTLLTVNPKRRPTAKEAQRHPWIQKWARKDCKEGTKLNPTTVNAIVAFKELTDMQKLLSEVLSYTLLPEQIAGLREDFEKIDNGDGEITLSALRNVLMENAESGSLGALTEREVEEIFQALRVRKTDTTIRWHEFIAGGLSQCEIDDRNLRLAFDRLDTDGKGFITFDDILDLMGTDGADEEESLQVVWNDATKQCNGGFGRRVLTYDDFVLLMKGQGEEIGMCSGSLEEVTSSLRSLQGSSSFLPIPEGEILEEDEKEEDITLSDDKRKDFRRMRSRSLGGEGPSSSEGGRKSPASFVSPGRYNSDVHSLIKDASQSPLVRNRSLYRAHRELRLAVLEASKRFEEKRANRVKATLLVTQGPSSAGHSSPGLIVRNESLDKPKSVLDHQTDLENASHRGGRHRERRIKTVSDMSVLLR